MTEQNKSLKIKVQLKLRVKSLYYSRFNVHALYVISFSWFYWGLKRICCCRSATTFNFVGIRSFEVDSKVNKRNYKTLLLCKILQYSTSY